MSAFTLGANLENLTAGDLTQALAGTGNVLNNVIRGSNKADILDGFKGAGHDTLFGYDGDDTYIVHAASDLVIERYKEGSDTVRTDLATYRLGSYVENLKFTGNVAHTGNGNSLDNRLVGDLQVDKLSGLTGNDTLDGGTLDFGVDTLIGGLGDDTYILTSTVADIVVESKKQGTDTVLVDKYLHAYTLAANVENLTSISTVFGDVNTFTGNELDNRISGGYGNDTLDGGLGNDVLFGGLGTDTFKFSAAMVARPIASKDVVLDFNGSLTGGNDVINIHGYAGLASYAAVQAAMTQHFDGVHIQLDTKNSVVLLGIKLADIQASDFSFI
jgi:serralysin